MADKTNDASTYAGTESTESVADKFANLKTQFAAEENGGTREAADEEDGDAGHDDAEADNVNDGTEGTDTDDSGDAADDDEAGDESESQESEFRFSQFKGDGTQADYVKKLEDGYLNSSNEAIAIKNERDGYQNQVEAIKLAAQRDPEMGKKLIAILNGKEGAASDDDSKVGGEVTQTSDNPFIVNAETAWNKESEKTAKEFADANPEVMTDPKINADVKRLMRLFSNHTYETEKRLLTAGEAMELAYRHLGLTDKRNQTQDLVSGMKKNAAPTRPQTGKKKAATTANTKQFSDLTLSFADKMGISKERLAKSKKR